MRVPLSLPRKEEQVDQIASRFGEIMEILGLDLSDPSLKETPRRVAEMYVHELCAGLDPENFPKVTTFPAGDLEGQTVRVKKIAVRSTCEHHFLPFTGHAEVAYIPQDEVIGLSKINRIVHYFCQRPQLQERLTKQIADALSEVLGIRDILVKIEAEHACVRCRGVEDGASVTVTELARGKFDRARA